MRLIHRRRHRDYQTDLAVARGIAFTSLAIGLTELLFPRQLERLLGLRPGQYHGLLRTLGIRELMHGADLLAHPRDPAPGLWPRVAGDALDGTLLTAAATRTRNPAGLAAAFALVAPVVLLDLIFARRATRHRR